ncbi:hypothetical protein VNO77_03274 [Canavalia gladiata]|uniref:Uncharacterized protein n=1 Tax=Canavalia gladiata TaxID=3824 RepID=A0AAN9MWG1_CANGL
MHAKEFAALPGVCEQEREGPCHFCGALVLREGIPYAGLEESFPPVLDAETTAGAYANRLFTAPIILLWILPSPYGKEHFMISFHGSGATRFLKTEST